MQHARRPKDEPPEPDLRTVAADLQDVASRAHRLLDLAEQVIDHARDGTLLPEGFGRRDFALLNAGFRHLGGQAAQRGADLNLILDGQEQARSEQRLSAMQVAIIRGQEQQRAAEMPAPRRRHAHRKPGKGQLALVRGDGRPAAFGATGALGAGAAFLRHSTTAKAVAGVGLAASVAVGAGSTVNLPDYLPLQAGHHASSPLPVLAPADAIPLGSLPEPSYRPRHAKPGQSPDASRATLAPPPPVVVVTSPPPPPSAAPSAAVSGTLEGVTVQLSIGLGGRGQITFGATGGPVLWSASPPPGSPLTVADASGRSSGGLAAGESETLYVTVGSGAVAGAGTVKITAAGQEVDVPVTWVALPGLSLGL